MIKRLINLSDHTQNQPFKFRTKNCVEKKYACGTYNTNSQIKFKATMLKSSLYDYGDAYMLVKGTIIITRGPAGADAAARQADEGNKGIIFKNCAPFTGCISKISNTQIDHAKNLDVMLIYNLIQYSDRYSETSGSSWQC